MRWDLAKCEKTGCCLPRIWIPNAQAKLQKNIARVRRQRKMTFDWRPWFVHLWFHFVAYFFYAVCTGSTNRLRNIATSELALPDKHKTKGKHWDLQSVQSSSTMTLRGWTTPTMFQSKYHSRQSTKLRVGYPKRTSEVWRKPYSYCRKKHHSNYPIRSDSSIFQSSSSKSLERGTLSPVKYGDKSGITKQCWCHPWTLLNTDVIHHVIQHVITYYIKNQRWGLHQHTHSCYWTSPWFIIALTGPYMP